MLKEMLVTLSNTEDSEKNWIKKLNFEISFNNLQNSRMCYYGAIFFRKSRFIFVQI